VSEPIELPAGYGQVAYEAYVSFSGGVSLVSGAALPSWAEVGAEIQMAWNMAAAAVVEYVDRIPR
jgi:hypothetical protein